MKVLLEFDLPEDNEKLMNFADEILTFFGDDGIVTLNTKTIWPNGIEKEESNEDNA